MSKIGGSTMIELEDRDPNTLSQHLQVQWDDVIGEPLSIRSPEFAWRISGRCFQLSRNCCYLCLSVIVAPISAVCLGLTFACLAFEHIWCVNPCLRIWKINCAATRNFMTAYTEAIVTPICKALGYVWSNIKVRHQNLPDGPDKKEDMLII